MRQNCIQSKNANLLLLVTGIRMARLLPIAAVASGLAASLSQSLFTLRNIHGACRGRVTSIASIKYRSNVSGQHRVPAAAL